MARQVWSNSRKSLGLGVIAAALASCAALPPALRGSDGAANASQVEHASPDDCAIIAAVGRSELPWDATTAPTASFYARFETPEHRTYLEDCPWNKLGLAAPLVDARHAPMGFAITRPVYSHHGATTRFQYTVAAVAGADGKKIPPFVEQEVCTLEKNANGWRLLGCKLTNIR